MLKSEIAPWLALTVSPERLWQRIEVIQGRCWPWRGRLRRDGYGQLTIADREVLAHRAAYFLHNRGICASDCIMHKCDNPGCCNPSHLVAGTHSDNMRDMKMKGRRKGIGKGETNGRAKLTQDLANDIRIMRDSGDSLKNIAEKYGVGISTISRVCRRENWA